MPTRRGTKCLYDLFMERNSCVHTSYQGRVSTSDTVITVVLTYVQMQEPRANVTRFWVK